MVKNGNNQRWLKGMHTSTKTGKQVKEHLLQEKETSFDTEFVMTERRKEISSSPRNYRMPVSVRLPSMAAARARHESTPVSFSPRLL